MTAPRSPGDAAAHASMGITLTEPCTYCGQVDDRFRWRVVGRGLDGWFHPACMYAALDQAGGIVQPARPADR